MEHRRPAKASAVWNSWAELYQARASLAHRLQRLTDCEGASPMTWFKKICHAVNTE